MAIEEQEESISQLISQAETGKEEWNSICYSLGLILTFVFSQQNQETGLRRWFVDDMDADNVEIFSKKITLKGTINWLGGGGDCVYYQVDIARDAKPILYSYKLQNKRWKQVMYIGKTLNGWVLNTH